MKIKPAYLIPIINCLLLGIAWLIISQFLAEDKTEYPNILIAMLGAFGQAMYIFWLYAITLSSLFLISLSGSIFMHYKGRRQLFLGFRTSLIINTLIIIVVYIIATFS